MAVPVNSEGIIGVVVLTQTIDSDGAYPGPHTGSHVSNQPMPEHSMRIKSGRPDTLEEPDPVSTTGTSLTMGGRSHTQHVVEVAVVDVSVAEVNCQRMTSGSVAQKTEKFPKPKSATTTSRVESRTLESLNRAVRRVDSVSASMPPTRTV